MGRYSTRLAPLFADTVGLRPGQTALDVGCGPGALTGVLVERVGPDGVAACDPSARFVADCTSRHPQVDVRIGRAEEIPFEDRRFDAAFAQLVLHFVSEPVVAGEELRRVVRPGGSVAACVWDFSDGMQMLRAFWDAALEVDPTAPDQAETLRFGGAREIVELFEQVGFVAPVETMLTVSSTYTSFDELWAGFMAGVGPAGSYVLSLGDAHQEELRQRLFDRLKRPAGRFELSATARSATGRVPG